MYTQCIHMYTYNAYMQLRTCVRMYVQYTNRCGHTYLIYHTYVRTNST